MRRYVIVDLEATCWEGAEPPRDDMETIELGAVLLAGPAGPVVAEFGAFIRPVVHPVLSEFCRQLTSIRQEEVDRAEGFAVVARQWRTWIGPEPFTDCDCRRPSSGTST